MQRKYDGKADGARIPVSLFRTISTHSALFGKIDFTDNFLAKVTDFSYDFPQWKFRRKSPS